MVPSDQARVLDEKMNEVGAPHRLMILEDQPHGIGSRHRKEATEAAFGFLDEHLKKP